MLDPFLFLVQILSVSECIPEGDFNEYPILDSEIQSGFCFPLLKKLIQDHFHPGESKEPGNPCPE